KENAIAILQNIGNANVSRNYDIEILRLVLLYVNGFIAVMNVIIDIFIKNIAADFRCLVGPVQAEYGNSHHRIAVHDTHLPPLPASADVNRVSDCSGHHLWHGMERSTRSRAAPVSDRNAEL